MTAILTLTLNPALDLAVVTPEVVPGPKLRCTQPKTDPGGGGVNVSRVIQRLGGDSTALVALGGPTGAGLEALLRAQALTLLPFAVSGETRISFAVTEGASGAQYRFVLPGPVWAETDFDRLCAALPEGAAGGIPGGSRAGIAVLSGSLPPGLTPDHAVRLTRQLDAHGWRIVADTSGPVLAAFCAGDAPLSVLRMDHAEAEEMAGSPLPERADSARFAAERVAAGAAETVVVARGPDGSVAATRDARWHVEAADVPVISKIGAGDSFVGAFTLALSRGLGLSDALAHGSAAASATVMTPGTDLCRSDDALRLVSECPVTAL